jgi:hypothetical protein
MIQIKKLIAILGCILLALLIVNCNAGKKPKKGEKERLVIEQQKLVENFKKKFKLTSEQHEKFIEKLEQTKKEESVEDIENLITEIEVFKEELSSKDPNEQAIPLQFINDMLQAYIPNFPLIVYTSQAKQVLAAQIQIWKNIQQQVIL